MKKKQLYAQAVSLYRAGKAQSALELLNNGIMEMRAPPEHLNLAAMCAKETGNLGQAEHLLRTLVDTHPQYLNAYVNLGVLLIEKTEYAEAEAVYQAAQFYYPNEPSIQVNMGNLYRATGRQAEAEGAYRRAIELESGHVDAYYNLGLLLSAQEDYSAAEQAYLHCLSLQPDQPDVYNDLGNLYQDCLRIDDAEKAYLQAIRLAPGYVDALFNLGDLLAKQQRRGEAQDRLLQSLRLDPHHADALNTLANLYSDAGHFAQAEHLYKRALEIRPGSATVYNNFANMLRNCGRIEEAEAAYRRAVEIEPDYGHALGQAIACARMQFAFSRARRDDQLVADALRRGVAGLPALEVLATLETSTWADHKRAAELSIPESIKVFDGMPPMAAHKRGSPGCRLRIGYLSADFRNHPVMHLLGGVLEMHDRTRFEVHAYSMGKDTQDAGRQLAERACEYFVDIRGLSDGEAARRIVEDGIDILVDLSGHTHGARSAIPAARPASVIVNWLGYPGTLGHGRLADYIIGDPIVTPVSAEPYFCEVIAQMPHCYLPTDRRCVIGPCPSRMDEGLPEGAFVFCNFNKAVKLNPDTFDVWCRILSAVPGSVLWMGYAGSVAQRNLRSEAESRGVAGECLIFAERTASVSEHLSRLQLADLALDTFPYTSHSTGCDLIRAGVPLVTLLGESFASRVAASLLHTVGLPELVAKSWNEYQEMAIRLAMDKDALDMLRRRLVASHQDSPLYDTAGFARDLEDLYQKIWHHHVGGGSGPIAVGAR